MAPKDKTVTAPPVGRIMRLLRRNAVRKGIFGGSRGWAAVAVGTWGYTTLKKMARREPELVFSEELKPGERIIISNNRATLDPSPQQQRP
jgi:hypothetical protein